MLLESALADFSTDGSSVYSAQPGTAPFERKTKPSGKPKPLSKRNGGSNSDGSSTEIKHAYQVDLHLPPSFKSSYSRQLSSPLDLSRSPPPLDLNVGPSTTSSMPKHRSLIFGADENPPDDNASGPSVRAVHPGKSASPHPALRVGLYAKPGESSSSRRTLNSGAAADEKRISFRENPQPPGKSKLQKDKNVHQMQRQPPPARVISVKERSASASLAGPQSLGSSSTRTPVSRLSTHNKESNKKQQERGKSSIPQTKGKQTHGSSKLWGDAIQVKKLETFNGPTPGHGNHSSSNDVDTYGSRDSEFKYDKEESPVSTLERIPSPPTTNSSAGSSGSLIHTQRTATSSATPVFQDASVPGLALARRRLSSFSSSSAQSSPRASTSSSARYMGHCFVALQAALAVDPERSKRFEDSFVEEGSRETPSYATSPLYLNPERRDQNSPVWAVGGSAQSELEPEYNTVTMDFYSDSEDDDQRSSAASSPARSVSGSSSTSFMSMPIRPSLHLPPRVSVDEYSVKDKRFLSDHPSSWVQHGDDSVSSSLTNSRSSTLKRHEDISWDDQQADLRSERAEELIRGAIDGLRFTYSPVSSAFVFTRSNEGDEDQVSDHPKLHGRHSRHNTTDSMLSVDYATSLCSDDSLCFARGSDVPELGMSRAESWSKVARGIAFPNAQHGYQDAVPSSFLKRAGFNGPLFESTAASNQSPDFKPRGIVEGNDTRLIRKRPSKKSAMVTCLPFRSILRNFKTIGSPGRSRLGQTPNDGQLKWTSPIVNRPPY